MTCQSLISFPVHKHFSVPGDASSTGSCHFITLVVRVPIDKEKHFVWLWLKSKLTGNWCLLSGDDGEGCVVALLERGTCSPSSLSSEVKLSVSREHSRTDASFFIDRQ